MERERGKILKIERVTYEIVTVKLDRGSVIDYRCLSGVLTFGDIIEFKTSAGSLWDKWTGVGTRIIEPRYISGPEGALIPAKNTEPKDT